MPDLSDPQVIGLAVGLASLVVLGLIIFLKANIILCQPSELLILAGRNRKTKDGGVVGYRVIRGGRGFKWPFLETVARLELTTIPLEVRVSSAMCAGMIPVNVVGRANVKLAGRVEHGMDEAIERFLGKGTDAVVKTAKQALEGALRGVLATVEPAQANTDRLRLAGLVTTQARADLRRLGVVLDFFQIQELNDTQGYLEAIGRQRNAEVQRDAKVAEAKAGAEGRQVVAEQKLVARSAEIKAELTIIAEENGLAVKQANLDADANRAQERARVAGKIARTEEEIELQAKRADLSEKTQQAETVIPAKARQEAAALDAQGHAARILENGKATAQAVELMREQWQDETTRDLFLIQLLPTLTDKVTRVLKDNLRIDKLTILDGGDGAGLPNYVKNVTNSAVTMMEQVKNATGVDLAKLADRPGSSTANVPKELN